MRRVLLVGDVIVDEYVHGRRLGISAETPTVVAEYTGERAYVGGAGLVARHLLRLGCHVTLATSCQEDVGYEMERSSDPPSTDELSRLGQHISFDGTWRLTRKRRYFVDDYKMVQYDVLNRGRWDDRRRDEFLAAVRSMLPNHDALVVSDNRHGVLDERVARELIWMARKLDIVSYVDSQVSQAGSNLSWYEGCMYALVNERELDTYISSVADRDPSVDNRLTKLKVAGACLRSTVVLKLGAEGSMSLAGKFPVHPVVAVDTCGAGDAFMAAFVQSDGDMGFANRWAARSTTVRGTVVPELEET